MSRKQAEIIYNRLYWRQKARQRRQRNLAKGLTSDGTIKIAKPSQPRRKWTPHGLSKDRAVYMKWWRKQRKAK